MLLRNALCAAALAVPLALATTPASADHDIDFGVSVGIGTPHTYGYGVYGDDFYSPFHRRKLSCWQARRLVREVGFRRIRTVECNGRIYTFRGFRRGHAFVIKVNARTGAVWRA
jgi:hypothetical protein